MVRITVMVIRSWIGSGLTVLACVAAGGQRAEAQQLRIESAFPRQLPRGQTAVIRVAIASRDPIQAAEISPPQGVTVSRIAQGESFQGALTWHELTFDVAPDAAPGERTLVLVLPAGRTAPMPIRVPTHVPDLTELSVASASSKQGVVEVQLAASDASADLGELPHVWYRIGCGREPLVGVVRGRVTPQNAGKSLVRASLPSSGAPAGGKCDLQVRVTDSSGIESNTLKTTVNFTP